MSRTPASVRSTYRGARRAPASSRSTPPTDLGDYWQPGPLLVPPPPIKGIIFNQRTQVPLAKDKVRHVGEPLAVVIAQSRYIAEDALDDIDVDLEPLPAVVDLEKALTDAIRAASTTTCAATSPPMSGKAAAITPPRAHAPITSSAAGFRYDHGISSPIETRGVVANGTRAPISSRSGTRPRRRCSCATGSPACWA